MTPLTVTLDLTDFLNAYIKLREDYWSRMGYTHEDDPITLRQGKRYTKLVAGGSAVAFIDPNGDIYMPASWSKPAKHVRGNIYSEHHGMEAFGAAGHVRYLK